MKKPILVIAILALLLILAASAAVASAARSATQSPPGLEGVRWVLVSYKDSQGKVAAVLPDAPATAEFADAKVSGTTGCNTYSAPYKASGNSLTVGKAVSTLMACADPAMAQEQAYLANLQAAATYKIDAGQLTIADASGATVLTYKAEAPGSLAGPTWVMTMYNNGKGGFQSAMAGAVVTAIFDDKGQVSGNGGCNNYNSTYTVDGSNIKFGPVASTMMACAQDVMDQETAYFNALGKTTTFKIEGKKLTFRDSTGAAMVEYTQGPAAGSGATGAAGGAAALPKGDQNYVTLHRGADGSVAPVVLKLKTDSTAEFTTGLAAAKPVVETGKWDESNGLVTVTLTDKDGAKLSKADVLKFKRDGTFLVLQDADKAVWGENGLKLNLAADIARRLRSSTVTFDESAGFPVDPTFVSAFAGGEVDSSLLGKGCNGFISREPVATVKWSGKADRLRTFFYSDGNPTLMVLTPDGKLVCNDNATDQILDPFIELQNPVAGNYRIWVGSAEKDALIPGVLVMSTKPSVDLGTFNLGKLVKRPAIPQTAQAPTVTDLGAQAKALADKLTQNAPTLKAGAKVSVDVTADGVLPLFRLPQAQSKGCGGLVTGAPNYAFKWSGPGTNLHIAVDAPADTTLMVIATNGKQVWCNDDAKPNSINPAVDIPNPAEDTYLVYVGRVSPEKTVNGKLTVVEAAKE
jgi:heat shock protein HslJ